VVSSQGSLSSILENLAISNKLASRVKLIDGVVCLHKKEDPLQKLDFVNPLVSEFSKASCRASKVLPHEFWQLEHQRGQPTLQATRASLSNS